jgi:hypothetical protein
MECLHLLKSILRNGSYESLVSETIDWRELLLFAQQQAIIGVFWQGIKKIGLEEKNAPTEDEVMDWYGEYQKIGKRNGLVYQKAAWLVKNFEKEGFKACILKGQGNALMYPDAFARTPGDIDVWVWPVEDKDSHGRPLSLSHRRKKILQYVKSIVPNTSLRYHHVEFDVVKGLPIEVHFFPISMNNPFANRKLQDWFEHVHEELFNHQVVLRAENASSFIPGYGDSNNEDSCIIRFNAPTVGFNLVYQMLHILHHFFDEGIGLRQFIDYYYLLKQEIDEKDKQHALLMFKQLHVEQFARAVMYIQKEVLGLEGRYLLLEPDSARGKVLLDEILAGGNFGNSFTFRNSSVAKKYFAKISRNLRLINMCPSEALWEPWFRTWHFFWRIFYKF